jgi:asparagine synthase (glutamine-hydrolysing)
MSLEKWPRGESVVNGASMAGVSGVGAFEPLGDVDKLSLHDMRHYLPGDILTKVDRASMAVSLETRIPFLAPAIAQFALSLPVELRLKDATGKLILREVLKRYVPESMFNRPKAGFAPPLEAWLRGPLLGWAEDLLAPERLLRQGFLNVKRVRAFWMRYKRGGTMQDSRAWALLQFQSWLAARGQ